MRKRKTVKKADPSLPMRLVSRAELAQFLGISERTVDRLRKAGMPMIKAAGRIRFDLPDAVQWLKQYGGAS